MFLAIPSLYLDEDSPAIKNSINEKKDLERIQKRHVDLLFIHGDIESSCDKESVDDESEADQPGEYVTIEEYEKAILENADLKQQLLESDEELEKTKVRIKNLEKRLEILEQKKVYESKLQDYVDKILSENQIDILLENLND